MSATLAQGGEGPVALAPDAEAPLQAAEPSIDGDKKIDDADPRLSRCAFAILRGNGLHEVSEGKTVDEFYVRDYDICLGRRSRNGGADVVLSGKS